MHKVVIEEKKNNIYVNGVLTAEWSSHYNTWAVCNQTLWEFARAYIMLYVIKKDKK